MMRDVLTIPRQIAGLHVLIAPDSVTNGHRRVRRSALRGGIDGLIHSWGWQSQCGVDGRRLCCMQGGAPAPPVSVSYSGQVALLFVSADWRSVGIDIEVTAAHRRDRYARIAKAYTCREPADAMATFVRAEAWAKANDCGFRFGASYFLSESGRNGYRRDGRVVREIDLRNVLPRFVTEDAACAAAFCADAQAMTPAIHRPLCVF